MQGLQGDRGLRVKAGELRAAALTARDPVLVRILRVLAADFEREAELAAELRCPAETEPV
jgi:hypothetical protein